MGIIVWIIVFSRWKLYSLPYHTPIVEEIRRVISYGFVWFLVYIGVVYLTSGFLTHKEIPRLIIIYAYIFAIIGSIVLRYIISTLYHSAHGQSEKFLIIYESGDDSREQFWWDDNIYHDTTDIQMIENIIRNKCVDKIIYNGEYNYMREIFSLAKIYGIPFLYPKISRHTPMQSSKDIWIDGVPMVELSPISITPWWRIIKRMFDVIVSAFLLIILMPVFFVVAIGVYLSDSWGPIFYKNRRIWQDGKIFSLYKFRYMYWKYCTKEAYAIEDDALLYEEELKKEKNTREWPLYKIQDDPRVMPFGRWIERLSLDELPQLYNVFRGDMSLIWPRPHQPREIALYAESDKQVLTIRPWITGMAQVYGREKNSFQDEITLDTYYIENYSLSLDIAIFLRTFLVVVTRFFGK